MSDQLPPNSPYRRPLSSLPNSVFEEISRLIDPPGVLTNAFMTLGERLGYSVNDCRVISARAGGAAAFNYSPTQMLLDDYTNRRNGAIWQLQYALRSMNHRAVTVIPEYFMSARHPRSRHISGVANTEPSGCQCPECQWEYQSYPVSPPYANPAPLQPPWPPDRPMGPPASIGPKNGPQPHFPLSAQGPPSYNSRNGVPADHQPSFVSQQPRQSDVNNVRFFPPEPLPSDPQQPQRMPKRSQPGSVPLQNLPTDTPNVDVWLQNNRQFEEQLVLPNADEQVTEPQREPPVGRSTRCIPQESPANPGQQAHPETSRSYDCDQCRLTSDSDETPVKTTIYSSPRSECQLHSNTNNVQRFGGDRSTRRNNESGINASGRARTCAAHNSQQDNGSVNMNAGMCQYPAQQVWQSNGTCQHSDCQDCALAASRGRPNSWPPADLSEDVSSVGLNSSSSDGSISNSRRNLQRQPTSGGQIQEIFTRTSFNNSDGTSARVVPGGEMAGSDQNGEINTDYLNLQMQNMNLRNEAGLGESTTSNNESNEPNGRNDLGATARPAPRRTSNRAQGGGNQGFVFVTFSWNPNSDDRRHLQEIVQLCRMLKEAGIRVKMDMDPQTFHELRINKQDWLDRMAREAKYVIVCLSPAYYRDTLELPDTLQPRPDTVQLNARYIFDLLRSEFHGNGARNYRFIPVLFPNSGATHEHIPACMRSTLVPSFPDTVRDIIRAIRHGEDGEEGEEEEDYHVPYPH